MKPFAAVSFEEEASRLIWLFPAFILDLWRIFEKKNLEIYEEEEDFLAPFFHILLSDHANLRKTATIAEILYIVSFSV